MINFLFLFAVGILGVLTANLYEIDKLNQSSDQSVNLQKYWQKNWARVVMSICLVLASIIAKQFISELQSVGKSLFAGVFAIGFAGPILPPFILSLVKQSLSKLGGSQPTA